MWHYGTRGHLGLSSSVWSEDDRAVSLSIFWWECSQDLLSISTVIQSYNVPTVPHLPVGTKHNNQVTSNTSQPAKWVNVSSLQLLQNWTPARGWDDHTAQATISTAYVTLITGSWLTSMCNTIWLACNTAWPTCGWVDIKTLVVATLVVAILAIPHPPWPLLISDVGLELEGTLINCSLL